MRPLKTRPGIVSVGDEVAGPELPDPWRRRGLRGDRHHTRRDPVRGQVLPGWRPDAHPSHVDRAPYGTIYGHHSRPRARRRESGLPTLEKYQREALERNIGIV